MGNKYKYIAKFYSQLMDGIDYDQWAYYLEDICFEFCKKGELKVLELAAGDGKLSEFLKDEFDFYIISDLSKEMLKVSKSALPKVCCDMRKLPFKNEFDVIFSSFDSINYLKSEEDLLIHFNEVSKILTDDGIFTFDASLLNNSLNNTKYLNRKGKFEGYNYRQISYYDNDVKIHYNKFDIELPSGERVTEVHEQRIYPFEKYFEVAEKSNLYVVACFDSFTFEDGNEECERVQFVMKKR